MHNHTVKNNYVHRQYLMNFLFLFSMYYASFTVSHIAFTNYLSKLVLYTVDHIA